MKKSEPNPTKTVLVISVGFLVVYAFTSWQWAFTTALVIGGAGILSNYLTGKIHLLWMKLASMLSLIIPNIILALIFYLVLFPIALLARVFRKTPPVILKNTRESMFIDTNKSFDKGSFEKPW